MSKLSDIRTDLESALTGLSITVVSHTVVVGEDDYPVAQIFLTEGSTERQVIGSYTAQVRTVDLRITIHATAKTGAALADSLDDYAEEIEDALVGHAALLAEVIDVIYTSHEHTSTYEGGDVYGNNEVVFTIQYER